MAFNSRRDFVAGIATTLSVPLSGIGDAVRAPRVEVEEPIYDFTPANNGASPLWAFGSPCMVRRREAVFVSGLDTVPGVKILNNCRWALHGRDGDGWKRVLWDEKGLQREPCPIGLYSDGRLALSTNPALTARDTYNGPADPQLLLFSTRDLHKAPAVLRPAFSGKPRLTEHTYRGMAVDGRRRELIVLHNNGTGAPQAHWAFLDQRGAWRNQGVISYPIRGCYPQVALRNEAAHVFAVGDVMEPIAEWRKWKFEQSGGRQWDYIFRRLFYVTNPAIASRQFGDIVEVDNVDQTAGYLRNLDLWLAKDGGAHVLYLKRNVASAAMRDKFFPGLAIKDSLVHAVIRGGRVEQRRTLIEGGEAPGAEVPQSARFHAVSATRLFVFACVARHDAAGIARYQNRLLGVLPEHDARTAVQVDLKHPFTTFFTATERGGSRPSKVLDLVGTADGAGPNTIRYARIRLS
jgi:hypothetical protein